MDNLVKIYNKHPLDFELIFFQGDFVVEIKKDGEVVTVISDLKNEKELNYHFFKYVYHFFVEEIWVDYIHIPRLWDMFIHEMNYKFYNKVHDIYRKNLERYDPYYFIHMNDFTNILNKQFLLNYKQYMDTFILSRGDFHVTGEILKPFISFPYIYGFPSIEYGFIQYTMKLVNPNHEKRYRFTQDRFLY
jgi:hypothetical protein